MYGAEYETITNDFGVYKSQRDEYERKREGRAEHCIHPTQLSSHTSSCVVTRVVRLQLRSS